MQRADEKKIVVRGLRAFLAGNPRAFIIPEVTEFGAQTETASLHIRMVNTRSNVTVDITADRDVGSAELVDAMLELLRFQMLFIGFFLTVEEIRFFDRDGATPETYEVAAKDVLAAFPSIYKSGKTAFDNEALLLCFPESDDYGSYLEDWIRLKRQLGVGYELFLIGASDTGVSDETRLALLAESLDTLAGLLDRRGVMVVKIDYFKAKLLALLALFGGEIFQKEYLRYKLQLTDRIVAARDRMNKLAPEGGEPVCFRPEEYGIYMQKLQLFYRHILLQLMNVDYGRYRERLTADTALLDEKDGIVDGLLAAFSEETG